MDIFGAPDQDVEAILSTVGTFRLGSPIVIDDIRFAAKVDGHDLSHLKSGDIAEILRVRCHPGPAMKNHEHKSWFRSW